MVESLFVLMVLVVEALVDAVVVGGEVVLRVVESLLVLVAALEEVIGKAVDVKLGWPERISRT